MEGKGNDVAEILQLRDGTVMSPMGLFDVMDLIEEELGGDVRDYLETHFMEEETAHSGDAQVTEHYLTVLEVIGDRIDELERRMADRRMTRNELIERLGQIQVMICRETKGDKYGEKGL